jgi:putative membrane protein
MFAWETKGPKIFKHFPKELFKPTKSMAANQGLYNGFLAAGLIWSYFINDIVWKNNIALFFLGCVTIAGIFGAITVSKKIFYIQCVPALLGILFILYTCIYQEFL